MAQWTLQFSEGLKLICDPRILNFSFIPAKSATEEHQTNLPSDCILRDAGELHVLLRHVSVFLIIYSKYVFRFFGEIRHKRSAYNADPNFVLLSLNFARGRTRDLCACPVTPHDTQKLKKRTPWWSVFATSLTAQLVVLSFWWVGSFLVIPKCFLFCCSLCAASGWRQWLGWDRLG